MAERPQDPSQKDESVERDCFKAWKRLITTLASALSADDVAKIRYTQDLGPDSIIGAVDVLHQLEKRGLFSLFKLAPLEELLREAQRHDLVNHVEMYRREHSREIENASAANASLSSTSPPPSLHPTSPSPPPSTPLISMAHSSNFNNERQAVTCCNPVQFRKASLRGDTSLQSWLIKRCVLCKGICCSREDPVTLGRMKVPAKCKRNPELGFRIHPYGLGEDEKKFATLQVDLYVPTRCPAQVLDARIKIAIRIVDDKNRQELNTDSHEVDLRERGFLINRLLSHDTILYSNTLTFVMEAAVEVDWTPPPAPFRVEEEEEDGFCIIQGTDCD